MEDSTVKERILLYAREKNLSNKAVTDATGLSNGLLSACKGESMKSENIAQILKAYPDLSAEWLMRGEGEMIKSKPSRSTYSMTEDVYSTELNEAEFPEDNSRGLGKMINDLTKEINELIKRRQVLKDAYDQVLLSGI